MTEKEAMRQKAAAFDAMQKREELRQAYDAGNEKSYVAGMRDGAAELNALMQEGLARSIRDPRMYDAPAVPAGYVQGEGLVQGGYVTGPDLRTSRETEWGAPEGSLASTLTQGR